MSKWIYKNKVLNKVPEDAFGFVYLIDFGEAGYYIGSKQIQFRRRKLRTKKDKAADGNNRLKYKEVFTESDWKDYNSSSKSVHTLLENNQAVFRIMSFHETKADMLLKEAYLILKQFINKDPLILNEWVSIKTRNQYGKN
jgi:hypothetical protein